MAQVPYLEVFSRHVIYRDGDALILVSAIVAEDHGRHTVEQNNGWPSISSTNKGKPPFISLSSLLPSFSLSLPWIVLS